jgi:DNA-binding transcriptional LysR family regulator
MHIDLQPYAQGLVGHITFFANNNAISSHLPDDLARFFSLYPNVRISLEERLSHDIVSAVAAGRADLGVVAIENDHPELEFLPYRQDELVVLAPLRSKFSEEKKISFSACLGTPFISLQHGAALHTFLMNHANSLGKSLDVRVQVSGYHAIARLVSSGAGIGIVPRSALQAADSARLDIVELVEPWAMRDLRVCFSRQTKSRNFFLEKLIEILCERCNPKHG